MIHRRDLLKRKAVKTGSQQFHDVFTKVRNKLNKLIKRTKADYFTNPLNKCENKPKKRGKQSTSLPTKNRKQLL